MDPKLTRNLRAMAALMRENAMDCAAASDRVADDGLGAFFQDLSIARAQDAMLLVGTLRAHALPVPARGGLAEPLLRGMSALRSALAGGGDNGLLRACRSGNAGLIARVGETLGSEQLPEALREHLHRLREKWMGDHVAILDREGRLSGVLA
jgi:hypothetical protein